MEFTEETASVESLGHLGLLAATIRKLGIDKKINARLPISKHKGAIVPHGSRAAAMILNGLGFINCTLYLSPHFFEDKTVSALLGEGIEAHHLNDNCLGGGLDAIAGYGTTKLYSEIMFEIKLAQLNQIDWITRVPATLKEAKELLKLRDMTLD
jgi:transposase